MKNKHLFISLLTLCVVFQVSAQTLDTTALDATRNALIGAPNSQWVSTGALNDARTLMGMSPLMDGRILATGGRGAGNVLIATAEIYDPATGVWTRTGSMAFARDQHTQALLNNGKVLVTGGGTGSLPAEIYDPSAGTWQFTGSMIEPRFVGHTATLLHDGTVLVTGGLGTEGAEIYNPATDSWRATRSPKYARFDHTATLLGGGEVLIAGGYGPSNRLVPRAEIFDPSTQRWTLTHPMVSPRVLHTATLLEDGRVLAVGGSRDMGGSHHPLNTAELYDPTTQTWSPTGNLLTARYLHTANLLPSGLLLRSE